MPLMDRTVIREREGRRLKLSKVLVSRVNARSKPSGNQFWFSLPLGWKYQMSVKATDKQIVHALTSQMIPQQDELSRTQPKKLFTSSYYYVKTVKI